MSFATTVLDDLVALRAALSADARTRAWLDGLDQAGDSGFNLVLPDPTDLPPILLELAVPHEDIDPLIALRPSRERSPALWWLLERCVHVLVRYMGEIVGPSPFPRLPEALDPVAPYFYVYVYLAAMPHVRACHAARGIPDDVSRLTLADLGRNMAVCRRRRSSGGLEDPHWPMLHFRGVLYQLGRLQFQRGRLGGRTGRGVAAAGQPYTTGDPALGVHIPDFFGRLSPEACDASFDHARAFFPRHFPDERYAVATCHSWLLDEQLADYLPADSNVIRFQKRFRPAYHPAADDATILRYVFGYTGTSTPPPEVLDAFPRRTALQRAVIDHLKAGRHWHGGAGFLLL